MSCSSCCRGILSFIIIINMFIGLAIVGSALWLYLDGGEFWTYLYGFNVGPVIAEVEYFHYVLYSLFALGAIKVFLSFIGCCSVSRTTFIPVFLLFGIQIAAGVCVWYFKTDFTTKSTEALTFFVRDGYHSMNTTTDMAFDRLQSEYECCGSDAPSDWSSAAYNEGSNDTSVYQVPPSCCVVSDTVTCDQDRIIKNDVILGGTIYTTGCAMRVLDPIYQYIYRYEALGVLAAYVLIEFLVMTLKIFACRKRYPDYEDSHMMELKPYR